MSASGRSTEVVSHASDDAGKNDATWFATTHWSIVLAAGQERGSAAQNALESLCRTYWYPLYAYVRRTGRDPDEAKDLTQEFFAQLLEADKIGIADPARGRFRTFLLTAMKHFLVNVWKKENRLKRGGGQALLSLNADAGEQSFAAEPSDPLTPETIYERRWAATLLERVLGLLGEECAASGRAAQFEEIKESLWGERRNSGLAGIAARLGMSEGALKTAVHRMRARYRELLRSEIAHTVASPAEIDEELRHLITVMSG
jgi:RNA polymerase sigma factor (sigma-70 family)